MAGCESKNEARTRHGRTSRSHVGDSKIVKEIIRRSSICAAKVKEIFIEKQRAKDIVKSKKVFMAHKQYRVVNTKSMI